MAHRSYLGPIIALIVVPIFASLLVLFTLRINGDGQPPTRPPQPVMAVKAPGPSACPAHEIYFAPGPGPQTAILREIEGAKSEILVQAYSFTAKPISAALIAAHRRGVAVRILLDRTNANPAVSQGDECAAAGVPVAIDHAVPAEPISHAKILVIDNHIGIYGSFNLSDQASKNSEVLCVERDPVIAKALRENWFKHQIHSILVGP